MTWAWCLLLVLLSGWFILWGVASAVYAVWRFFFVSAAVVWLVLTCLGPALHPSSSVSECEDQSYALPSRLAAGAWVAACSSVLVPGVEACEHSARLVRVESLTLRDWLPGQFFDSVSGHGVRDVVPARSVAFGHDAPQAIGFRAALTSVFFEGMLVGASALAFLLFVWEVRLVARRRARSASGVI